MARELEINAEIFGRIFSENREKFTRIARSYVRDEAAAEDIVLDAFTSFWLKRNEIQINTSPEYYILQSIKNKCLNYLRDKQNHKNVLMPSILMSEINILERDSTDFILGAEAERIFNNFLKELNPLSRDIFLSSRVENLTYEQIAQKYNISQRKVKREIQNVLHGLRIALADYLPIIGILPFFNFLIHG